MSGAIPLLPLHAFMAREGTAFKNSHQNEKSVPRGTMVETANFASGRHTGSEGRKQLEPELCVGGIDEQMSSLNIPLKCVSLFCFVMC